MRSRWLGGVVVVVAVVAGLAPASAGAAGWSLEGAANVLEPHGALSSVSCSSPTWCVAVGGYLDEDGLGSALVQRWDGSAWAIVPTPHPAATRSVSLSGVSCVSATACVAVGKQDDGAGSFEPIAERWDGTSWTLETMPAGVTELDGVSCTSASACTAVGGSDAVRWDGTSWKAQALELPPNPDPYSPLRMTRVSCASATACTAVGFYFPSSGPLQPVAEQWDGTSWTIAATPLPSGAAIGELSDVSCTAPTACTAVGLTGSGSGDSSTWALRWNGTAWSTQATPNTVSSDRLVAVSCGSATSCVAAGERGMAAHWDGTSWTLDANAQATLDNTTLNGVSCDSATSCTAVGGPGHTQPTMAEHWNGTSWTQQTTPPALGALETQLQAVSCPGTSACFAVGTFAKNGDQPLAERWNGSSWTVQTVSGSAGMILYGVSCPSASACMAVGYSEPHVFPPDPSSRKATAVRWNGTAWTTLPIVTPAGAKGTALSGVSCRSASSCIAVGTSYALTDGKAKPLTERWNGTKWTLLTTPKPLGSGEAGLNAVSCSSTTACTAVGSYMSAGASLPLAERWNGTKWTVQTTPASSTWNELLGVSCPAAKACTAVGSTNGSTSTVPLVERWNGTSWAIQPTPSTGPQFSLLNAVSCVATSCEATGYFDDGSSYHPLAERWDGTAWTLQSAPEPAGARWAYLLGVSCTSATACHAVGPARNVDNHDVALAERYG
jgi:hypothetical protein